MLSYIVERQSIPKKITYISEWRPSRLRIIKQWLWRITQGLWRCRSYCETELITARILRFYRTIRRICVDFRVDRIVIPLFWHFRELGSINNRVLRFHWTRLQFWTALEVIWSLFWYQQRNDCGPNTRRSWTEFDDAHLQKSIHCGIPVRISENTSRLRLQRSMSAIGCELLLKYR